MSETTDQNAQQPRPNEISGFHFEGHIKIFDPTNGEVFHDK